MEKVETPLPTRSASGPPRLREDAALVLLSGGQDSATCLADALARFAHVETVGFDYGQRHQAELTARQRVREYYLGGKHAAHLGEDHTLSVPAFMEIGSTAMTADMPIERDARGLPTTFVPGRNIVFLALAAALAVRRGIGVLVGGMCETDAAGYPDCRSDTLRAMEQTLALGIHPGLRLDLPLLTRSKAQTWALAHDRGGKELVQMIVEETHTCYRNNRDVRHPWGYGCGTCPACVERARGFEEWAGERGR